MGGRAAADGFPLQEDYVHAFPGQIAGDGAADYAGANDDNFGGVGQVAAPLEEMLRLSTRAR